MDIVRKKNNKKTVMLSVFVAALLLSIFLFIISDESKFDALHTTSTNRQNALFDTVKHGDLTIKVDAYGTLVSENQKLLNTQSKATVEQIWLKPGAKVTADSIILTLSAPELNREYEQAKNAMEVAVAHKRYMLLEQKRELLTEHLKLKKLQSKYNTASFNSQEISTLASQGIISKLNHLKMKSEEQELKESIQVAQESIKQLQDLHKEGMAIQDARILRAKNQLNNLEDKVSQLTVRAKMPGIVQSLFVELGQSVDAGSRLATVADNQQLMAIVKVAQSQAELLTIGLESQIKIVGRIVKGAIVRIDPGVHQGTVTTEVAFDDPLPSWARPSLAVDGQILIETLSDILYIRRPVNARPNTISNVYAKAKDDPTVKNIEIEYGAANQHFIQIKQGVSVGTQVMISAGSKVTP